jgi:hypothetical protein
MTLLAVSIQAFGTKGNVPTQNSGMMVAYNSPGNEVDTGGTLQLIDPSGNSWTTLNGYFWDLPGVGTYTIMSSVRPFFNDKGTLMVKLGVDQESTSPGAKLVVGNDDVFGEYGESTRGVLAWSAKRFSFMGNAAYWEWQVTVTGPIRVTLQSKRTAGSAKMGFKSDSGGWGSMLWYKMEGVENNLVV